MSDVVQFRGKNALANAGDMGSALKRAKNSGTPVSDFTYLRMGRDGIWIYGAENLEVEEGSRWAINPLSFKHGWVCWHDSDDKTEKLGEEMHSVFDEPDLPARPDAKDGGTWTEQWGCDLVCVSGEDEGTEVSYHTNSKGGLRELRERVAGEVADKIDAGEPCVAVVELEAASYKHKTYGKTYTPDFQIKAWADMEANVGEDEPEKAEKTTRKAKRGGKAKETKEVEATEEVEEAEEVAEVVDAAEAVDPPAGGKRRRRRT